MTKLIILDRDGVINEDSDNYVRSTEEWLPLPGSIKAMARLHQAGFTVTVATNQSGLARGYFDIETLNAMHAKMNALLSEEQGVVAAIKYCPHGPDDQCKCRKPLPGMVNELIEEFQISPAESWMVGDSLRDLQAGQAAGCNVALVKTGKGIRTLAKGEGLEDIPVFEDLADFTHFILTD
ncbi:D-glycero-beta-D-manno-heptose-1,7-bisphosphate 7-phosphatase [Endozoicomonas sp. OPT23]|uniref:D-glycero-beta-D-manno-heptose 1,7-bisphosphate 7-phosphatase n=1 Tax=Endozoicomonas sp. OPT23 TaxID=2072845 RepID=UPI00129A7AAC|nr:D-glycero-beta-D-manno-heptose 1,7-bisphosphate 7-phosphatase [Endozoicomonas sp. OPT23]MRI33384.1 D-glycero-beta-D-manno-heptose-1,7-bisphosphate 7-phosphatase [Endozoicomonas sp. OPT23]